MVGEVGHGRSLNCHPGHGATPSTAQPCITVGLFCSCTSCISSCSFQSHVELRFLFVWVFILRNFVKHLSEHP